MARYPLNGRPTAFFRGDWFVGKGVACAMIRINATTRLAAFCTHLHAPYEMEPHDSYICHRTGQAWEIAKLMRSAAERGDLVVGMGDFNMVPMSLAHQIITTHAPVKDVWREVFPDSSIGAAIDKVEKLRGREIPTAHFNVTQNGATCDSVLNTWRWRKEDQRKMFRGATLNVEGHTLDPRAKRLDYIFFGSKHGTHHTWHVEDVKVGMMDRHPTIGCSLSDHFSVEATISKTEEPLNRGDTEKHEESKHISPNDLDTHFVPIIQPQLPANHNPLLPPSTYHEILTMIHTYTLRERRQRRLRLSHFLLSVFISISCLVAVFWSPHNYVSFVLMLFSTLGLGAGIVDGLIGGLFVGSELRALKEFEWEIKCAARKAEGGRGVEEVEEEVSLMDWYDG